MIKEYVSFHFIFIKTYNIPNYEVGFKAATELLSKKRCL